MVSAELNLDNIKAIFQKYWKVAFSIIVLIIFICMLFKIQHLEQQVEKDKQEVQVITSEHAKNVNALQNELGVNKQNAEVLAKYIQGIQTGRVAPNAAFTITSSSPEQVVKEVVTRIESRDTTLPPSVYDKSDKTVVTQQPDNKDYQVGVYKINTYRNWEAGIGVGVQDGNVYVPISLQRNYDKNHSIEAEVHLDKDIMEKNVSGGALKWNIHF